MTLVPDWVAPTVVSLFVIALILGIVNVGGILAGIAAACTIAAAGVSFVGMWLLQPDVDVGPPAGA